MVQRKDQYLFTYYAILREMEHMLWDADQTNNVESGASAFGTTSGGALGGFRSSSTASGAFRYSGNASPPRTFSAGNIGGSGGFVGAGSGIIARGAANPPPRASTTGYVAAVGGVHLTIEHPRKDTHVFVVTGRAPDARRPGSRLVRHDRGSVAVIGCTIFLPVPKNPYESGFVTPLRSRPTASPRA